MSHIKALGFVVLRCLYQSLSVNPLRCQGDEGSAKDLELCHHAVHIPAKLILLCSLGGEVV